MNQGAACETYEYSMRTLLVCALDLRPSFRKWTPECVRSLTKTRPERDPQRTSQCVYSTAGECSRSYIGETARLLAVRLREHKHFREGLLEKSELALEIESNSRYRKYKESVHRACLTNSKSQPTLDIALISDEVTKHKRSLWQLRFPVGSYV
jgi:hypothetical protein